MNSYLLLRNNQETGPYSLEELVNFGMKPYDLVWVNGKSAAWRYPSEVQELKPYAPAVEEQPYDRFYKKPVPIAEAPKPEPAIVKEIKPSVKESDYQPKVSVEAEQKFMPGKSVFVTLPGQAKAATGEKVHAEVKKAIPEKETPSQTISISENPASAKTKYSQPLDDIKEMYVKTLQDRKSRIARKGFWLRNLKIASVILGLVGMGALGGFILKPGASGKKLDQPSSLPAAAITATTPPDSSVVPADEVSRESSSGEQQQEEKSVSQEKRSQAVPTEIKDEMKERTGAEQPAEVKPKSEPLAVQENSSNGEKQFYLGAERNPISGERRRTVRDNTVDDNRSDMAAVNKPVPPAKSPLDDQVTVTSNEYKKVAFGGIRNLQLTVINNSKYELDNVVVELQYLKPSELPLKTDNILFKSIPPNESATIRVPDTNRGIKVLYKIVSIGSKTAMK